MSDGEDEAIAVLHPCPNLMCGRMIGIAVVPYEPSSQVFCGYCMAEVEFANPYYEEGPISSGEDQEGGNSE